MSNQCEHKSKKTIEKKKIAEEELPCAHAATVTTPTYEIVYECKGCGERWTETKEETKLDWDFIPCIKILYNKKCYV